MPFTFTMPKLSPTMEVGTIAKWYKKEGDHVEPGELLLEVSTDKATLEHNVLDGGWLRKILIQDGEEARVNQPIAIFTEEEDESIEGYQPEGVSEKPMPEPVAFPSMAEPIEEKVKVALEPKEALIQPKFVPEPPPPAGPVGQRTKASPLARKLAKDKGVDLTTVKGTGPGGRVMSYDLERAEKLGTLTLGEREHPMLTPGTYEEEELTPIRKVISQRLQESKTFIPHFYVNMAVDVQPLTDVREELRNLDIRISINDFIVRACALALRDHPNINSGFNSVNQSIIRYKTVDISVAVSVDEGLITPIIRNADYKSIGDISVEIRDLAKKAREGKLELHEFKGGSFTVSNLGMYEVAGFQAIINPPQAAILAVSGIQNVPVVKDGKVVPGMVMAITLSSDHRVIDGVAAAKFVNIVKKYLENPAALLV